MVCSELSVVGLSSSACNLVFATKAAADLQSSDLINLYASELDSFTSSEALSWMTSWSVGMSFGAQLLNQVSSGILSLCSPNFCSFLGLPLHCDHWGFIEGDGDTQAAATAAQTLSVWNQRLQSDYDTWLSWAILADPDSSLAGLFWMASPRTSNKLFRSFGVSKAIPLRRSLGQWRTATCSSRATWSFAYRMFAHGSAHLDLRPESMPVSASEPQSSNVEFTSSTLLAASL